MVFERAQHRSFFVLGHVTSRELVPVLRTLPAAKAQQLSNVMLLRDTLENARFLSKISKKLHTFGA